MSKLDKLKTLIPLEELENDALQQIYTLLEYDFVLKMAIMPDCHTGYTMPIGGVALLDSVISPELVGFDQFCGMTSVRTEIPKNDLTTDELEMIFKDIKNKIPCGEGRERTIKVDVAQFKSATGDKNINEKINSKTQIQCGTLGGGNHFLEVGYSNIDEKICITIHSGSRNPGHSLASFYIKLSEGYSDLPKGFFYLESDLGRAFYSDLMYMEYFSNLNRRIMITEVLTILGFDSASIKSLLKTSFINENHNHAVLLNDKTILHRKGATPAEAGSYGVIPGNMRDGVFVTVGLGNEEFLCSASHGAGRSMSRTKAKQNISEEAFKNQMDGIICSVDSSFIDEAPGAYKDVFQVIKRQEGIVVDILDHIKPLINVKG
jgi:tRNA-splicing ligase RtcB